MNWDRRCAKASLSYSILSKRVEDLEQETRACARIEKIPVNSWSIDRSTVGDFMQESQTARCSKIQKTSTVLHVMPLPVSQCGLQVSTESS